MRRANTTRFVTVISVLLLGVCVAWAFLAEQLVPDACTYAQAPERAQILHCPDGEPTRVP